MFIGYLALLILSLVLLVPVLVFFTECSLAVLKPSEDNQGQDKKTDRLGSGTCSRPRTTILIPAHNEATVIADTLTALLPQLTPQDQIVVVADNCTDNTAEIALNLEVKVLERQDHQKRGKGYALDYGMEFIKAGSIPPEIVIILDADCITSPNAIEEIARKVETTGQPVQATYLMEQTEVPSPNDTVSTLALIIKNLVRPLGLARLGLPCLLTGSGMGFPWSLLSQISLAGNKTVDDMQLSVDLAITGSSPVYCPQARILGRLMKDNAAQSQRKRWEHGHLEMIFTESSSLLKEALVQRRLDLLALALELCVPPLSLLLMIWLATSAVALLLALIEGWWLPLWILGTQGLLIFGAVLLAWVKFARQEISVQNLLAIPGYIIWKIPIYLGFVVKPQTRWLTTERDN